MHALKKLIEESFNDISNLYVECAYGLLFDAKTPLLRIMKMFLKDLGEDGYELNILMKINAV